MKKRMKEEKELRVHILEDMKIDSFTEKWLLNRIAALVRAVRTDEREECAKAGVESVMMYKDHFSKKDGILCESIMEEVTASIRARK